MPSAHDKTTTAVSGSTPWSVVVLHGFGANKENLSPLAEAIDPEGKFNWYFLDAPIDLGPLGLPGGKAWFELRLSELAKSHDPEAIAKMEYPDLDVASVDLMKRINALKIDIQKTILAGFSQGAILSMNTLLLNPNFAGLLMWSGSFFNMPMWKERLSSNFSKLCPVYLAHGRSDPVLPFMLSKQLADYLLTAKVNVSFDPFEGDHEIPWQVIINSRKFLEKITHGT